MAVAVAYVPVLFYLYSGGDKSQPVRFAGNGERVDRRVPDGVWRNEVLGLYDGRVYQHDHDEHDHGDAVLWGVSAALWLPQQHPVARAICAGGEGDHSAVGLY